MAILFVHNALAQDFILPDGRSVLVDNAPKWVVELNAMGMHQSNALPNSIADAFLFGGHIDEGMKDALSNSMRDENSVGGYYTTGINLIHLPEKASWGYMLSLNTSGIGSIAFTEDAGNLIFRGNSHFGNTAADLSDISWLQQSFHKLQVGMIHARSGSYIRAGIYSGASFADFGSATTSLSTQYGAVQGHTFAERIQVITEDIQIRTATGNGGLFSKGLGIGIDANWIVQTESGTFTASVADFGFTRWRHMERRDTSGQVSFSGFRVDFSNSDNQNALENLTDSLVPSVRSEHGEWEMLPAHISLGYISPIWQDHFFASVSFRYRHIMNGQPSVTASLHYTFKGDGFLWTSASYGHGIPMQLGLGVQKTVFKTALIGIYSAHVPGFFMANGRSRGLSLQWIQRI